jgi:flagellar hook-basal body complex protein FliE
MAIVPLQAAANAASAYAKAPQGVSSGLEVGDTQSSPFANLLKGAVQQAIVVQKQSEAVSVAAIADNADMSKVVTAVAEAEATLQAVTVIRDKIIEGYREILRMPV